MLSPLFGLSGKDLSSRSETDLACIFGKRSKPSRDQDEVRHIGTVYKRSSDKQATGVFQEGGSVANQVQGKLWAILTEVVLLPLPLTLHYQMMGEFLLSEPSESFAILI